MLNFEEELAKFQPAKSTDILNVSVREELGKQDIAGFVMEIVEENRQNTAQNTVHRQDPLGD